MIENWIEIFQGAPEPRKPQNVGKTPRSLCPRIERPIIFSVFPWISMRPPGEGSETLIRIQSLFWILCQMTTLFTSKSVRFYWMKWHTLHGHRQGKKCYSSMTNNSTQLNLSLFFQSHDIPNSTWRARFPVFGRPISRGESTDQNFFIIFFFPLCRGWVLPSYSRW